MKVVNYNHHDDKEKKSLLNLHFEPKPDEELTKLNSQSHELRSVPSDPDSAKCKVTVRVIDGSEDVDAILKWRVEAEKVLVGFNLTAWTPMVSMIGTLVRGQAESIYREGLREVKTLRRDIRLARAEVDDTADGNTDLVDAINAEAGGIEHANNGIAGDVPKTLDYLLEEILPRKVYARTKKWLRRDCRKPTGMTVHNYALRLRELNLDVIGKLPPYNKSEEDKRLTDDEMIDILLYGTPKSWQREMERQGFDPIEKEFDEVSQFMQRIEASEEVEVKGKTVNDKKKPAAKKQKSTSTNGNANKSSDNKGSKCCANHGWCAHTTEECRGKGGGKFSGSKGGGDKPWAKESEEAKTVATKDLNAYINKWIKKGVAKELASLDKKRKASEDFDLHAIEDGELKNYNYAEMDNLKIDSDDEISI